MKSTLTRLKLWKKPKAKQPDHGSGSTQGSSVGLEGTIDTLRAVAGTAAGSSLVSSDEASNILATVIPGGQDGANLEGIPSQSAIPSSRGAGELFHGASGVKISGSNLYAAGGDIIIQPTRESSKRICAIGNWLTQMNYLVIWIDNLAKRTEGTGIWLFRRGEFCSWMEKPGETLCGTGMPGSGKTILSSIAVEYLQNHAATSSDSICVVCAFCRYTDQVTTKTILAGLVKQYMESERCPESVMNLITAVFDRHERTSTYPSVMELVDLLKQLSQAFSKNFYILDGLDEAPGDTQIEILEHLSSLRINLLIMSRPTPLLTDIIPSCILLDITAQEHDIDILIKQTIKRYPRFRRLLSTSAVNRQGAFKPLERPYWEKRVFSAVQAKSRGMFLLASLQMDLLRHCLNVEALENALESLPSGIMEMYRATVERIQSQPLEDASLAQQAIMWIIYAQRPLTMPELRAAVAVSSETCKFDENRVVHEDDLATVCCGLVTNDKESGYVRLVHYTAVDALKELLAMSDEHSHAFIASACVNVLVDANFTASNLQQATNVVQFSSDSPSFLRYSHENWAPHATLLPPHHLPPAVVDFVGRCRKYPFWPSVGGFWGGVWNSPPDFIRSHHIAACYDLPGLLSSILSTDPSSVNIRTTAGRTSLSLAAMEGNLRIVQLLLECPGIDVNSSGKDGRTPLMEASFNGHLQIVQLLLACSGIEVNAVDEEGWTALMFSSLHRDGTSAEVTRLLLESPGIDVSMKNLNGDSALILAANLFWSSLGKLRTLVGFRGIDLDIRDAQGKNVLMTSIGTGRQDMVEMLLGLAGVQLESTDNRRWTALMMAAEQGNIDVVRLLVDAGANVDAHDEQGDSALTLAATRGSQSVVKLLLELKGIHVETDQDGLSLKHALLLDRQLQTKLQLKKSSRKAVVYAVFGLEEAGQGASATITASSLEWGHGRRRDIVEKVSRVFNDSERSRRWSQ